MEHEITASAEFILSPKADTGWTHLFAVIYLPPAAVGREFGDGLPGDDFKVSREYSFACGDLVFTLYDWKSTDLYDPAFECPAMFWATEEPVELHIGSKEPATANDIAKFAAFLKAQCERCTCPASTGYDDPFYVPDNWCKCGMEKHHWHCGKCKGLLQVG